MKLIEKQNTNCNFVLLYFQKTNIKGEQLYSRNKKQQRRERKNHNGTSRCKSTIHSRELHGAESADRSHHAQDGHQHP